MLVTFLVAPCSWITKQFFSFFFRLSYGKRILSKATLFAMLSTRFIPIKMFLLLMEADALELFQDTYASCVTFINMLLIFVMQKQHFKL